MAFAYAGRTPLALAFLGAVLLVVIWQLFGGLRTGVIYVPGKRGIFRVVRQTAPFSFWGAIAFYGLIVVALNMAAWGVLREAIWPGPSEPTRLTVVALDHKTVEVSWLPPERRDPPPSYGVYRSTKPGGDALDDYTLIATVTWQPYEDRSVKPGARYYYRVASNYNGQPAALSEEDSTVTSPIGQGQ